MSELNHECGVVAVYVFADRGGCSLCPDDDPQKAAWLMPRMLQDIQNRGQLSAGMTSYQANRGQLIDTHKEIGSVTEVFRMSHPAEHQRLMERYNGNAAIGHVRYATCGKDDRSYAQPFERHHLQKPKWFSFSFNGQLANYRCLRDELLEDAEHHLARESDTEIIMHQISRQFSGDRRPALIDVIGTIDRVLDGAYSIAYLNAQGEMLVARDPLGIKPMCYAIRGPIFAAASESVALFNLGFELNEIKSLEPGHAITIEKGKLSIEQFAETTGRAHCFFEWIYFANVASTLDDRSVYLARTELGAELAELERQEGSIPLDDDTVVVAVPDTSKAAADSMAFHLGIPAREGLIRNRYAGRTFIQNQQSERARMARAKYTPLREVLNGKRVILVEDSIVRSTTMKALLKRIYKQGGAKEVHVRVACPPIIAPCFYGIDMSTIGELFAPRFLKGAPLTDEIQREMAKELGCDSLRYLPVESIARAIGFSKEQLCEACITGNYPTEAGNRLYQISVQQAAHGNSSTRTYESSEAGSSAG